MSDLAKFSVSRLGVSDLEMSIDWMDGHTSTFPSIWLLNACTSAAFGSTETGVRLFKLTDHPGDPRIKSANLASDGDVQIDWASGHRSQFTAQWLRGHCLSKVERAARRFKPIVWDKRLSNQIPYMDYPELVASPEKHLSFLETVRDIGFVILRDVPKDQARTEEVASLVGKLRITNYGIFELESKPNPELSGDLANALELHTDEPYRVDPPGITLFHVLQQSEHGGDSTLADGINIANRLREQDPEAFRILVTIPARFHRSLKEGRAFEIQAPIISCDESGNVIGIRILDRGMAPVDTDIENVKPFYDALRKLLDLIYGQEGGITMKLAAGEMLVFNNQRLLHGRTAFDPSQSHRHVRTCNVDFDEFHSRLRVAYRKLGREEQWMNLVMGSRLSNA